MGLRAYLQTDYLLLAAVVRVTTDLEDVTTSLDVHSVYCKVKSKVGAVCVNHYIRR